MQLNFPFSTNIDVYDEKNFIIHDGNREAFVFIKSLNNSNGNAFLLSGVEKSGKTYLCNIWQKIADATFIDSKIFSLCYEEFTLLVGKIILPGGRYILEDLFDIDESKFLHFLNVVSEKHCVLLMTSKKNISDFDFMINDLKSRFKNVVNIKLQELNESSKKEIILKLLADKQMNVDSDVLDFISEKISGNYDAIFKFINELEKLIQNGELKKIKVSNIKELL